MFPRKYNKNGIGMIICRAVLYLLDLLENDDPLVCVAAGEGLAVIFESRNLDKFCSREEKSSGESSAPKMYSCIEEQIKGVILEKLERLSEKQISDSSDKVKRQYLRVLDYFKVLFLLYFFFLGPCYMGFDL